MNITELIAASLVSEVGAKEIEELSRTLMEAEHAHEIDHEKRAVNSEILGYSYSL